MNLHYQYYWFKEAIPHDICDKIIQMGNKKIEQIKKNGDDASGTTRGVVKLVKKQKMIKELVQKN